MSELTAKQARFVAAYLGEAEGNATEACRIAGYRGDANVLAVTGFDNLRKPNIAMAIQDALGKVERRGIAIKQRRLNAKSERWQSLLAVRVARAAAFRQQLADDPTIALPPGWESGFHVRQVRAIPEGRGQTKIVEEFALDSTMLREFNTLEKEIAHELGQLDTSVNVKHSGRVTHEVREYDFSIYTPEEQAALDRLAEKFTAGEIES